MTPTINRVIEMRSDRGGFSLIEMLVAIAIIATLTSLLTVAAVTVRNNARIEGTKSTLATLAIAIEEYADKTGGIYPSGMTTLETNTDYIGSVALVVELQARGVLDARSVETKDVGGTSELEFIDKWQMPIYYSRVPSGSGFAGGYLLFSFGPDKTNDGGDAVTADDIEGGTPW